LLSRIEEEMKTRKGKEGKEPWGSGKRKKGQMNGGSLLTIRGKEPPGE
jgi:hypothetical protein